MEIQFQDFDMQFIEHERMTATNISKNIDFAKFRKLRTPSMVESNKNQSFGNYITGATGQRAGSQIRQGNFAFKIQKTIKREDPIVVEPKTSFPLLTHEKAFGIKTKLIQKYKEKSKEKSYSISHMKPKLQVTTSINTLQNNNQPRYGTAIGQSKTSNNSPQENKHNQPDRKLQSQPDGQHLNNSFIKHIENQKFLNNSIQLGGASIMNDSIMRPQSMLYMNQIQEQNVNQSQIQVQIAQQYDKGRILREAKQIQQYQDQGILGTNDLRMTNIVKRIGNYQVMKQHKKFHQRRAMSVSLAEQEKNEDLEDVASSISSSNDIDEFIIGQQKHLQLKLRGPLIQKIKQDQRYFEQNKEQDQATLSKQEIEQIYQSRCKDLGLVLPREQELRFKSYCQSKCINGKIILKDTIRYLDLQKNSISDQGITILMHAIKRSKSLYYLNLSSTALSHKGAKRIFRALRKNESLISLHLGCVDGVYRNRVGMKGLIELHNMLQTNKTLNILDLSYNRIMNEGFKTLIFAIENQENIISLNVANNEITSEVLEDVKYAMVNTGIMSLEINNNPITNDGLDILLANLKAKYKAKLIRLNLSSCQLTHKVIPKIFPILSKNKFLRFLILDQNNFEKDAFASIKEGLRNNTSLKCLIRAISSRFSMQSLDLSFNRISDESHQSIKELLLVNKTLKNLNFKSNLLRDVTGKAIVEALNLHNKYIFKIELTLNQIPCSILEQIKQKLQHNEQNDSNFKSQHYNSERLKIMQKKEKSQNVQAQQQYEKALIEMQKINEIADDKQAKMNKLIDNVKNQIKRQEQELDSYEDKFLQIDKYYKKLDFEAIVKQKLKESEYLQLDKTLKHLQMYNYKQEKKRKILLRKYDQLLFGLVGKAVDKYHKKLDFYIKEVSEIQIHIDEEKEKQRIIKEQELEEAAEIELQKSIIKSPMNKNKGSRLLQPSPVKSMKIQ
eukprot:403356270